MAEARGRRDGGAEVLWAPWRMQYIEAPKPDGCIFCTPAEASALRPALILGVTAHARVMLNKYPYNNGHLLIAPRRHTAQLAELPEDEFRDLMSLLRRAVAVVETALRPQGVNVGMNLGASAGAGVTDHLHWHVVPRWIGDTNFMPVVGAVRVLPQHLLDSYDQLRPHFAPPAAAPEGEFRHSHQR
ncbi:MAG TPA: HIT domain-containing protein [Candidatus Binatia bacterium]|nr:HIT domain-containing protein [Candidatus Binatia bacterium]